MGEPTSLLYNGIILIDLNVLLHVCCMIVELGCFVVSQRDLKLPGILEKYLVECPNIVRKMYVEGKIGNPTFCLIML